MFSWYAVTPVRSTMEVTVNNNLDSIVQVCGLRPDLEAPCVSGRLQFCIQRVFVLSFLIHS